MGTGMRTVVAPPPSALPPPALAFALFHQPQRLGEIAGLQARLPLHAADLLARFPDDFLHAEKTILVHVISHGGLGQFVLFPPDLPNENQQLLFGQAGSLHAFPDPSFRLLDRVRVPPDLVADDLDLPLLPVDLLDRLLHFPVERADLLLPAPPFLVGAPFL